MVSGFALPVSCGRPVSQCAEAMAIARGLPRRRPSAAQARPAAPASRACIGEPCERKTLGSVLITSPRRWQSLYESFGLQCFLHLGARGDPLLVVGDRRPLRQVELR